MKVKRRNSVQRKGREKAPGKRSNDIERSKRRKRRERRTRDKMRKLVKVKIGNNAEIMGREKKHLRENTRSIKKDRKEENRETDCIEREKKMIREI